ncbi:hypothetical protein F4806DRAFT_503902 [Annulohypoxylon nitens]|nr:hypothetical protein F4806DRAFT_503902 [Annulohypoxylon nitens]
MTSTDYKLDETLVEDFKKAYGEKRSAIECHVTIVKDIKDILEGAMKSEALRAIPIETRMKELDSALFSLEKKQKDRLERSDLKKRMKAAGYNYGKFENLDSIMEALHDFGGARICVYFPQDVEKVVSWLQGCEKVNVIKVTPKAQRDTKMPNLRRDVDILQRRVNTPEIGTLKQEDKGEVQDSGYRATHVIVELQGDALPKYHEDAHYKVEIQIGTVVMHAWSQIEHDIIYKPDVAGPSDEQRGLLEVFNSIVRSGESALKQLAKTNDERARERAKDMLGRFLDILRSKDKDDTSGALRQLLEHLRSKSVPESFGEDLPLYLLKAKHEIESKYIRQAHLDVRSLTFRVVQSINIATYLGVVEDFILHNEIAMKSTESSQPSSRPSLIDFLDVLHPKIPQLNGDSEFKLIRFCKDFLDTKKIYGTIQDRGEQLRVVMPLLLIDMGKVVHPERGSILDDEVTLAGGEILTVVPYSLAAILDDTDRSSWIPLILRSAESAKDDVKEPNRPTKIDWGKISEELFPCDLQGQSQEVNSTPMREKKAGASLVKSLTDAKSVRSSNSMLLQLRKMQQGYFEPSNKRSSWEYVHQEPLQWTVKTIDLWKLSEGTVGKYSRANVWVDFANCLGPSYMPGILSFGEKGPEKYSFWVDDCYFVFNVADGTLNCTLMKDMTSKLGKQDAQIGIGEAENGDFVPKTARGQTLNTLNTENLLNVMKGRFTMSNNRRWDYWPGESRYTKRC